MAEVVTKENSFNKFFSSWPIAVFAFIISFFGYMFGGQAICFMLISIICFYSLSYSKSLNGLLVFLLSLPLLFNKWYSYGVSDYVLLASFSFIIALQTLFNLYKNKRLYKRKMTWGKLAGGLSFALIGLLFCNIGGNYVSTMWQILALIYFIVIYVLSASNNQKFMLKTFLWFVFILNLEVISCGQGALVFGNSGLMILNIFAICASFISISKNNIYESVVYNFIAFAFLAATVAFCSDITIILATMVCYFVCALKYMFTCRDYGSVTCILSMLLYSAIIIIADQLANCYLLKNVWSAANNFAFVTSGAFDSINYAFGNGFVHNLSSSPAVLVLSVGIVGTVLTSVLIIQTIKYGFRRVTYKKGYFVFGLAIIMLASLFTNVFTFAIGGMLVMFGTMEAEDYRSAMKFSNKPSQKFRETIKVWRIREKTFYERCLKRPLDIILSLMAIICLSPVFLIIFIASKISIGGKAIFVQYRPGKDGKVFKMYKFRSMNDETDEKGNLLPDSERITKFGKVIRKLSVDELPQLFNILKGDMSIIGTRPRVVQDIVFYDEYALQSYSIRPGLTSLSQVNGGRNRAGFEDIIKRDVYYAGHITFWGDVAIILKTFTVLFDGSTGEHEQGERQDYLYSDYLLRTGQITKRQYNEGKKIANDVVSNHSKVEYTKKLHKK